MGQEATPVSQDVRDLRLAQVHFRNARNASVAATVFGMTAGVFVCMAKSQGTDLLVVATIPAIGAVGIADTARYNWRRANEMISDVLSRRGIVLESPPKKILGIFPRRNQAAAPAIDR